MNRILGNEGICGVGSVAERRLVNCGNDIIDYSPLYKYIYIKRKEVTQMRTIVLLFILFCIQLFLTNITSQGKKYHSQKTLHRNSDFFSKS